MQKLNWTDSCNIVFRLSRLLDFCSLLLLVRSGQLTGQGRVMWPADRACVDLTAPGSVGIVGSGWFWWNVSWTRRLISDSCEHVGGSAAGEQLHRGVRHPGEPALWTGTGHPEGSAGSWRLPARMSGAPGPAGGVGPGGQRGSSGCRGREPHGVSPTGGAHCSLPGFRTLPAGWFWTSLSQNTLNM